MVGFLPTIFKCSFYSEKRTSDNPLSEAQLVLFTEAYMRHSASMGYM